MFAGASVMAFLQGNRAPIAGHKMSVWQSVSDIAQMVWKTYPQSIKAVVISFSKHTAQSGDGYPMVLTW